MEIAALDVAALASFLILVIAWLVLPLRVPTATLAAREAPAVEVQAVSAAA